jgi:hypothetical protein
METQQNRKDPPVKRLIIVAGALVALALPSAALAAAPTGGWTLNENARAYSDPDSFHGSTIGLSSTIIQNGQFVGGTAAGQSGGVEYDNTNAPGSRSGIVQDLLGHQGTGKPSA